MTAYLGAIVVGLLLVIVVAALVWKFSLSHLNGASRSFFGAVRDWEQALGVNDRYDTPWLLMVGDADQSEPMLRGWGLVSVGKPAWFGRWWYGPDGAVLVVPATLFNHGENASAPLKLWRQLLELLVQARANRPLDAVIWLYSAEQLSPSHDSVAAGLAARRKFIDLQQRLGLSLPVYILLSGIDAQPGISDLLEALPPAAMSAPFGWASPYSAQSAWHPDWISQALAQLQQNLAEVLLEIGALRGQVSAELYLLPDHLQALQDALQALCDPVFQGNSLGEAPRLRGLYFSVEAPLPAAPSAQTAPAPGALSALDPFADDLAPASAAPLFTQRLWRQRIVAEQGLAQPISRILQLRQRWQQLLGIGASIAGIVWLLAMAWAWHVHSGDARQLAGLLQADRVPTSRAFGDDDARREQIDNFWRLLAGAPGWRISSLVLPGSWFSDVDPQLEQALRARASTQLYAAINDKLQEQTANLIAPPALDQSDASDISTDEAYQQATQLLDSAVALEGHRKRFIDLLQGDAHPLDDASSLANDLFGLNLQPKALGLNASYNRILANASQPLATAPALDLSKTEVGARYLAAMRLWIDSLFASQGFGNVAKQLDSQLRALQSGQSNSLAELEDTSTSIEQLRHLIILTNAAWGQTAGAELTPGYQAALERARQSNLIGPQAVEQVERYAEAIKRSFHDRWLDSSDDKPGLLRQEDKGALALQDSLDKLDQGVQSLLHQSFSQAVLSRANAPSATGSGLVNLDSATLDDALRLHGDYLTYLQQDVAQLPSAYRTAMIGSARASSAEALWGQLNASEAGPQIRKPDASQPAFDLPVDKALQVLQALDDLGTGNQVEAFRHELNGRALNDLHRAALDIDSLPLLRQPIDFNQWDGTRNLSLRSFREPDVQGLTLLLNRQYLLIGNALGGVRPAIDWLNTQRERLSPGDAVVLDSFTDMAVELKKYADQNPASSPMLYQLLVTRDLNDMDVTSCARILAASMVPLGQGTLATLARNARDQAQQRCDSLLGYNAGVAYQRLHNYFNAYLVGRFPFSKNSSVDANPQRVSEFLDLIDKNLAAAFSGLQNLHSPETAKASQFIFSLQNARQWLGPLLLRNKEGLRGLNVEVRWRTDRDAEHGADQVIDWNIATGPRQVAYPAETVSQTSWTTGEPVTLALRWATGSDQRPLEDANQPSLAVAGQEASWSYSGPWALLRLMDGLQADDRFIVKEGDDQPLVLTVPVRSTAKSGANAQMFLRLSLNAVGAKQPLVVTTLPDSAPDSPFGSVFPLPVDSNEVQP